MNCIEIREIISSDLDFQATDEQLVLAFNHLAECNDCRKWRSNILEMKNVFTSIEDCPVPSSIKERLRRSEKLIPSGDNKRSKKIYSLPRRLVWAAAAVVIIQLGWSSYQFINRSSEAQPAFDIKESSTIVLTARDRTSATTTMRMPEAIGKSNSLEESGEEEN